tara:strand:- start:444 stop:752 length:309 start_codon:yes stop_codon:yes gene_type:complete
MMMMGMGNEIKGMFKKMTPAKNHDKLVEMGYKYHEKPEYYTDANGKVIPQEVEFNENGHYFDGKHYRDAKGNIVDDDYPHLKLVNGFKSKFGKLQKSEAGME